MSSVASRIVGPGDRLVMLAGSFGSGKTEVAVNLALHLAREGRTVHLADLDLVNPYFRSREARALLEAHGIRVVVPLGPLAMADLPILLPEVRGMLEPPPGTVSIFDVGGDDVGARVLSTFRPDLVDGAYQLWQVLNAQRPFTNQVGGCLALQRDLERASRLAVTGLLANSHLIDETTPETVLNGWQLARKVSRRNGLPIRCVAVLKELASEAALRDLDVPLLPLRRTMLPPWRTPQPLGRSAGEIHGTHRD
ncbi:MAG: cobalamin biosynthesis protein CbiA [Planctomycetota bacterium]